ncbi:MAG: hypothetical protein SFX73_34135 [Kofleriaceae bacterium]|nr:hypothetical protein [Kofleriaceae bacterium]
MRLVVVVSLLLTTAPAWAWRSREHRALGTEAYIAVCKRLEPLKDRDAATAQRFAIACNNLDVQALLYGQACNVSGDFAGSPGDMLTALGAGIVTKRSNYLLLALTNGAHFQPIATREWRHFHQLALSGALAAAKKQGAAQIAAFEEAFYDSAFGDHFLQDSFAAGHMGFNRHASSAAAAKSFHDEWNERGRMVRNRKGETWRTYGDNYLDRPENAAARAHVLVATTESVYGVVAAFVLGEYDPASDFAVWNEVAYTIEDAELLPTFETLFAGSQALAQPEMLPLLSVQRPAVKDGALGVWTAFAMRFDEPDHPTGALLIGGDLIIPRIGVRAELGGGVGFVGSMTEPAFAVDASLVRPLGLSWSGLLSHELDVGALLMIGGDVDATLRLAYRGNIEAGDWLLRLEVGPGLDLGDAEFGLFAGLGILRVMGAAGGGGFF